MEPLQPLDVAHPALSVSRRELFARYEACVHSVIAEYVRVKGLPLLAASPIDPDQTNPSTKLTFGHIEFIADVEKATEEALEGRPDLQRNWFQMAFGESIPAAQKKELILRCGRIYTARRLQRYWVRDRYAHRRPK